MACPGAVVEGDGLQMWRATANIHLLKKQLRTVTKALFPNSKMGIGF
jgi:hypothetical protein